MDINLLKTYNMSLTDIYKQLTDVDAYDSMYVPGQSVSRLKKWVLTIITVLISFGLIGALLILAFDPFKKPAPPVTRVDVPMPKPDIVPAPPDYVQIHVIDFIDDNDTVQPAKVDTPAEKPAGNTSTRPSPQRTQTQPTMPATSRYSVVLAGASPGDYDIISSLARARNIAAEIADVQTVRETRWIVYAPQAGTGLRVENLVKNGLDTAGLGANVEVTPLRNFTSEEEAVAYAASYGTTTIILTDEVAHSFYELRVCCMELEAAKQFANDTRIIDNNKVFQVIPE